MYVAFLSTEFPFLGASPDGIMYIGDYKIGFKLVEVSIQVSPADACKDSKFYLTTENGRTNVKEKP